MRISDWSSDVCSSDLQDRQPAAREDAVDGRARVGGEPGRRIRLPRIAQVNQMVRNVGALAGGRLCRADVEPAVDQSRIDAEDLSVQAPRTVSSEERRVGTECVSRCRSRWSRYNQKKN